jgi:hypothetical protein
MRLANIGEKRFFAQSTGVTGLCNGLLIWHRLQNRHRALRYASGAGLQVHLFRCAASR